MNDTVEDVVHRCSMALFVLAVSFVAKDVSGEAPVSVSSRHVCLPGRVMPILSAVAMPKSRYRLYDGGTQGGRDDMTVAAPHVPPVRPSVRGLLYILQVIQGSAMVRPSVVLLKPKPPLSLAHET